MLLFVVEVLCVVVVVTTRLPEVGEVVVRVTVRTTTGAGPPAPQSSPYEYAGVLSDL